MKDIEGLRSSLLKTIAGVDGRELLRKKLEKKATKRALQETADPEQKSKKGHRARDR